MAVAYKPQGWQNVIPYLMAQDARGVLSFAQEVFGAELIEVVEREDGSVMHAELRIGDSIVMVAQGNERFPALPAMLYVYVEDCDAVYQKGLAAGATSLREPTTEFYGDRSGGFGDSSGNQWWVATHVEDVTPEEMERRVTEWKAQTAK
jgi:PhnB protein